MYYIWQDPYEADLILTDEALVCNLYNDLILVSGYEDSIDRFNDSLLAEEIREKYSLEINHCLIPKKNHKVNVMIFGMYDTYKYMVFAGEINENQNSVEWRAIEANSNTTAEEVAALYAEMDSVELELHKTEEKIIYHFSGENGWFFSTVHKVKEFSTVYLWDYEDAICAVIVPGAHEEKNFEYCDFVKKDI